MDWSSKQLLLMACRRPTKEIYGTVGMKFLPSQEKLGKVGYAQVPLSHTFVHYIFTKYKIE